MLLPLSAILITLLCKFSHHRLHVYTLFTKLLPRGYSISCPTYQQEQNKPFTGWIGLRCMNTKFGICSSRVGGKMFPSRSGIQLKQLNITKTSSCAAYQIYIKYEEKKDLAQKNLELQLQPRLVVVRSCKKYFVCNSRKVIQFAKSKVRNRKTLRKNWEKILGKPQKHQGNMRKRHGKLQEMVRKPGKTEHWGNHHNNHGINKKRQFLQFSVYLICSKIEKIT